MTMQNIRKKILETIGVYIASWVLTYVILLILSTIDFGSIAGSILGTAFYSCFLFLALETVIITIKILKHRTHHKTKRVTSKTKEASNTSLQVVGTYAISLSITINLFLAIDPLSIYFPQADETLIRAFIVSITLMILLLLAQTAYKIIRNNRH